MLKSPSRSTHSVISELFHLFYNLSLLLSILLVTYNVFLFHSLAGVEGPGDFLDHYVPTGSIPTELGQLTALARLYMCEFTFIIPKLLLFRSSYFDFVTEYQPIILTPTHTHSLSL